jgi:hypothetical protein
MLHESGAGVHGRGTDGLPSYLRSMPLWGDRCVSWKKVAFQMSWAVTRFIGREGESAEYTAV